MSKKVLIISQEDDAHLEFVTKHLTAEEVVRIDPIDIVNGLSIDFTFRKNRFGVVYKDMPLTGVKSVWYRRPSRVVSEAFTVRPQYAEYTVDAVRRHVAMLTYAFPRAFWMPPIDKLRKAESKLYQLRVAARVGFAIPETLFASSAKQAEAFVQRHGTCIAKTQAGIFPPRKYCLTKIINKDDRLDFSGLRLDPFTFQAYIEPKYEVRATVVGGKLFAAKVWGDEIDGITSSFRDWRYAHANDTFKAEAIELPRATNQKCIEFVKQLGLPFGALDLIVDKNNKTWFLEINPNGQWAFVEQETGQPIGAAIAEKLRVGR